MAATFDEAYVAARDGYGERWETIKPSEQIAAIYCEMRRIDAEHVERAKQDLLRAVAVAEPAVS